MNNFLLKLESYDELLAALRQDILEIESMLLHDPDLKKETIEAMLAQLKIARIAVQDSILLLS